MVDKKNKKKKKFAVSDVTQADGSTSNNDIVIEAEDEHAEGQARC